MISNQIIRKIEIWMMQDARCFVMEKATSKASDFAVVNLTNFVTEKFECLTDEQPDDMFVRSESQCWRDLVRWGFYLEENRLRPYCEGE
jgi:hypothetical protein